MYFGILGTDNTSMQLQKNVGIFYSFLFKGFSNFKWSIFLDRTSHLIAQQCVIQYLHFYY